MDPHIRDQVIKLYQRMPGAPMPPKENGSYLWGDVEGNEHWEFCEAIVRMAINAAQAYSR